MCLRLVLLSCEFSPLLLGFKADWLLCCCCAPGRRGLKGVAIPFRGGLSRLAITGSKQETDLPKRGGLMSRSPLLPLEWWCWWL